MNQFNKRWLLLSGLLTMVTSHAWVLPKFDHGDHLHPSDTGYEAMGNAVDLQLLKP